MHRIILFIEKYVAIVILLILSITLRYKITGLKKPYPKPVIYIFWHRNIIPLLINRKYEKITVMISSSKDGDYIAEPAKLLGYKTARGSSTRGGTAALKETIKIAKTLSIAITPDGPKGPPDKIKDGAIMLAYITKLPIYAARVNIDRKWTINSWDKFIIPKPFAKIDITYSKPYYIKDKNEFDKKIEIEKWMQNPS